MTLEQTVTDKDEFECLIFSSSVCFKKIFASSDPLKRFFPSSSTSHCLSCIIYDGMLDGSILHVDGFSFQFFMTIMWPFKA